ncbi:pumilio homolog 12-like [Macadamia integrifolia]|uniref:pumilio homolog 12-like n=1 Tax=Macadamia integrifolia TaxID=60698 RepID=UPI001C4F4C20|nr:pumilio homolog 12-like [Macadamia integrifolia]
MTEDHKRGLLDIIIENSVFLAQDPHGNYVVQHVLRIHNPFVNRRICHKLQEFYVRLSMQKSGSHVVETCAKSGGIVYVVNDLVQSDKLVEVAKNQFGNYVIQTVLKATKSSYPGLNLRLEIALQPHLAELQYHPNGRNVYNLIKEGIINPFNGIKQVYWQYC